MGGPAGEARRCTSPKIGSRTNPQKGGVLAGKVSVLGPQAEDNIEELHSFICPARDTCSGGKDLGRRGPQVQHGFPDSPFKEGSPSTGSVEHEQYDTSSSEDGMVLRGRRVRRRREGEGPPHKEAPRRKKLGRPLVYEGDPDTDPTLTEEQRRRIRRRIANRESARRVRDKRLLKMGWMHDQMDVLREERAELAARVEQLAVHRAVLKSQLADAQGSLEETEARNKALQQECASLRRSVECLDQNGLQGQQQSRIDMASRLEMASCNSTITIADWPAQSPSSQVTERHSKDNVQQAILNVFPSFALDDVPMCFESLTAMFLEGSQQ